MEEIYRYCDKIIERGVLSQEALSAILRELVLSKRVKRVKRGAYDVYKSRATAMNTRAKNKGIGGTVTAEELRGLMEKQGCCQKCGRKTYLVFDHIVPLYRGGENKIQNLQVLCRFCNMEKGVN